MKHVFINVAALFFSLPVGHFGAEPISTPAIANATSEVWNASSHKPEITIAAGGLPIILTAPHGGSGTVSGVPDRKGVGVAKFSSKADTNTDILTERLASALEEGLGKRPYVVIARFHRKYIDVNRRPEEAYESPEAKPTYDAYHSAIASACKEITERWGSGVLLDIHGQAFERDVVIRGTQDGKTVAHLIKQSGHDAVYGETSLFGELAKQGFTVFPKVGSAELENSNYSGGHTVGLHGSGSGGSIDAIQLELGAEYRQPNAITDVASKMAAAITAFAKRYLPVEERKK